MNNVRYEQDLYLPMCKWLETYLKDKYRGYDVLVIDSHAITLDKALEQNNVISKFPQVVGLDIQIDVLGIVKNNNEVKIVFIEAKKTALTLHDLGQLWAYSKLCNPAEAFLLSSKGLGSLEKILKNLNREDMLDYGDGKKIKKMNVAKWDILRNTIDNNTIIPKI